ncbi:protein PHLOEM PROTEIN 2-LIKE A1-like isoform X1 [Daucus carota subsp. sativus]|uniref:protein PHLOEM PROTEIN 2-LIKE A1-like isoform X1 n=1 Tax=Daucus carota subsp. sativus TaxID=79200 RepID=UPI0007EFF39D|nr:PREDICTED: protein PHLOEM PROTEIN 2-LIKE A1-like [Daucus carota subsp. sativus]
MAQLNGDGIQLWAKGIMHQNELRSAVLSARNLSIVWGSDGRYWKWERISNPISSEDLEIAELIEVCWLQIDGKYRDQNLAKGVTYGVYFIVKLEENHSITRPVTLKLTCPSGNTQENKVDLKQQPKKELIGLKVGEFTGSGTNKFIRFSFNGREGTSWKTGLTCFGAVIVPV